MSLRTQRILLAVAIAFAYLYPFPYFSEIRSANELPRAYLTQAMVDEGTVAIDTGVARYGKTVDVSPFDGHSYSNKAPGSSMLAAPAYLVLKGIKGLTGGSPSLTETVWVSRLATGIVPTLLFLLLLWRFLKPLAPNERARRAVIVAYALGSMAMTYSLLFIAHQLSAAFVGTALILSVWFARGELKRRWIVVAGFAMGAAVLTDYQAAFAGVPLAFFVSWRFLRPRSRDLRAFALMALGAAIPIAVLFLYHDAAFGHPLRTGYHASETFAHFHQRGFLGLDQFRSEALWGSTFAADNGLFFLSPFWLIALVGFVLLFREKSRPHPLGKELAVVCVATFVIYIAFISSIAFWRGGWQLGPRYITVMLPFLVVGLAVAVQRIFSAPLPVADVGRGLVWGLIVVGVCIYSLSSSQFQHFPEKFGNPFFDVTLRLYGDGAAPYSVGWALGLRGIWAHLPFLAAVVCALVLAFQPTRKNWRIAAIGAACAVTILLVYSQIDGVADPQVSERAYRFVISTFPK